MPGNRGVADWPQRLQELLALTLEAGEPWEEAMSRNDLGHLRMEQGDLAEAEADRVPQARSMILGTIAATLRDAGRAEHAYDVLLRCVEVERAAMRELSELQLGLERARIEMELLRDQAERDPLTGLHNRRHLQRAHDVAGPVGLAALDLDHFKAVNDRFGHEVGDRVLVRVAELLREQVRS